MPGFHTFDVMVALAPAGVVGIDEGARYSDADHAILSQPHSPFAWQKNGEMSEPEADGLQKSFPPSTSHAGFIRSSSPWSQPQCPAVRLQDNLQQQHTGMRRSFTCARLATHDELVTSPQEETPSLDHLEKSSKAVSMPLEPKQSFGLNSEWPMVRSGHSSDQGPRQRMEDAHLLVDDLSISLGDTIISHPRAFYGVFDGHGGDAAAKYVSGQLLGHVLRDVSFPSRVDSALRNAFLRTDQELEAAHSSSIQPMEAGTTALAVMLLGKSLFVANAGDCRAVLCRAGKVVELTRDHRPSCLLERKRVEQAGGFVVDDYLNDQLAVTRALGDWHLQGLKARGADGDVISGPLIADPEIRESVITEEDEFIVLACDGLWDAFPHSNEVISFARRCLRAHNDPVQCSQELVQEALRRNSCDNVTVVTVCLSEQRPPLLAEHEFRNSRLKRSVSENQLRTVQQ